MFDRIASGRVLGRKVTFACMIAISSAVSLSPALAGQCPADQTKRDAREPVTVGAKGVTDTTLGAIDLSKEPAQIKDRQLRLRKLTIEPGGIVPWHSHADRPALIYVAKGEIMEYASDCAVPMEKSGPKQIRLSTGGRISAKRRSCCSWATCCTTRTTRTCERAQAAS